MTEPGEKLIPKHGGYKNTKTWQLADLIYDVTVRFCDRFVDRRSRTHDQMVQAARSGVQNIAEGSEAAATSNASGSLTRRARSRKSGMVSGTSASSPSACNRVSLRIWLKVSRSLSRSAMQPAICGGSPASTSAFSIRLSAICEQPESATAANTRHAIRINPAP